MLISKFLTATCFQRNFEKCMSKMQPATIFAHSSGQGKCGVAVIRVSGSESGNVLKQLTKRELPKARLAALRNIINPKNNDILDRGLVLWFPGPHSFTGEDCCEFQVHGSVAVIKAILETMSTLDNVRIAKPGEFSKRAFHNGKLDLTEVEGLADLLQAETEIQRKQAFLQSQGSLSNVYRKWSEKLTSNLAHFEAYIDFDETETLEEDLLKSIHQNIAKLKQEISNHLEDGRKGERLRNGVKTVILGGTNVGKSSLLNTLCQRPAAIVTPIEGTTRDVLEITLDIGGYPLVLVDTAGLRKNYADVVEEEGINRALAFYEDADLVILLMDVVSYELFLSHNPSKDVNHYLQYYVEQLGLKKFFDANGAYRMNCIPVMNKIDLANRDLSTDLNCISCKTELGIDSFLWKLEEKLEELCGSPTAEHPCMNQVRHKENLSKCLENLDRFLNEEIVDSALHAELLRIALHHLSSLTGKVTSEQILDVIFRDFCIGK